MLVWKYLFMQLIRYKPLSVAEQSLQPQYHLALTSP